LAHGLDLELDRPFIEILKRHSSPIVRLRNMPINQRQ